MASYRRAGALVGALLCSCFGDPPGLGDGSDAESGGTGATSPTTANTSTPTNTGEASGTPSEPTSTIGPDSTDATSETGATTGTSSAFCTAPQFFAIPPFMADGYATRFNEMANLDGTLWIAGSNAALGVFNPAAWTFDGSDFGPTFLVPSGTTYELVSFVDGTHGPARVVYNEINVRAMLFDSPAGDFGVIGSWFYGGQPSSFGEVVRTPDGVMWAAGTATGASVQPYWRLVTSPDQGMTWQDTAFVFTLHEQHPATARALAVSEDGRIVIGGVAEDAMGVRQWIAFSFIDGEPPEPPDTFPDGSVSSALIVGDHVFIGGDRSGEGELRHATGDGEFERVAEFDHPVQDLAVARDDVVLVLSGTPDAGFTVTTCDDLGAVETCWRKLHEEVAPDGAELVVDGLFVDGDTIWTLGYLQDIKLPSPAGALFGINCPE